MQDQSLFIGSQPRTISEGLQNFIDAMVEEIVLDGKPFDSQKKYLKKFSENEGLNYDKLEADITTFIEILAELKKSPNKLMERFAEEKGRDCYLSESLVGKFLCCSRHKYGSQSDLIVLVIANNDSMNELSPLHISKLEMVEMEVRDLITRFKEGLGRRYEYSRLAVINYAKHPEIFLKPTFFKEIDDHDFTLPLPNNEKDAFISEGLEAALQLVSEYDKQEKLLPSSHIILISDGVDDNPSKTQEILNVIQNKSDIELFACFVETLGDNSSKKVVFYKSMGCEQMSIYSLDEQLIGWIDRDIEIIEILKPDR